MKISFYMRGLLRQDEKSRSSLVLFYATVGLVFSIIYACVQPYFNFKVPQWIFIAEALTLLILILLNRLLRFSLATMCHLTIGSFWVSFSCGAFYSGGIYSFVTPWVSLMPIMAGLLLGYYAARWWILAPILTIIVLTALNILEHNEPWRPFFSNMGLVSMLYLFVRKYDEVKTEFIQQVSAKSLELEKKNEQIRSQLDFIQNQNDDLELKNTQILHLNQKLENTLQKIIQRNASLEQHWNELLEISKSREVSFGDFQESLRLICRTAATSLHVHRVSVWKFIPENQSIKCLVFYNSEMKSFHQEADLSSRHFPTYIAHLQTKQVVAASQARTHEITREFTDIYLKPREIFSMMDTPYFIDGELGGILCCEQKYSERDWRPEDILFAQALSDIITLAFRASQRREYERELRAQKKEISAINQSLEARVLERTLHLTELNEKLTTYAHINSHLLRGPICRILGLLNLLSYPLPHEEEKKVLKYLLETGQELESITQHITSLVVSQPDVDPNNSLAPS